MTLNRTADQIKYGNKGKSSEGLVQDWLDEKSKAIIGFNWHRMPDARAARGALGKQPSDFLVGMNYNPLLPGRTWWLEVKEVKEGRRLPRSSLRQYGMLKVWSYSSIQPLVVVHHLTWRRWLYLEAGTLFEETADGEAVKSFLLEGIPSFGTHEALLNHYFEI